MDFKKLGQVCWWLCLSVLIVFWLLEFKKTIASIRRGTHGVVLQFSGTSNTPGGQGGASENATILASETYGQRPTPVEDTQTFSSTLNYTMAKGETHGFLLKVSSDSNGVDLNCSGSAVTSGDITCTFYKLWAFSRTTPINGTDQVFQLQPQVGQMLIMTSRLKYLLVQVISHLKLLIQKN